MSSKRSSRSKRTEASPQIKVALKETNGTDDDTEQEEIEINSNNSEGEESSASDKPQKKRGESSFNRAAFSMPDDIKKLMERVTCCSCGKQLNPMNHGAVRKHPWLKVVTCKKCYRFLRSGPFTRDDDGIDEQCRWCGDGGHLYGCDYCHNCFCRSCIKRNLGRSEATMMENDGDSKWHCYICKPKKIKKLVEDCNKILDYIEAQEKKEREREERAKQREKEKSGKLKDKSKKEEKDRKEEKGNGDNTEREDSKDRKEEKSTPKRGLPAPREKSLLAEKINNEKKPAEPTMTVTQSAPDLIVIGDSPTAVPQPPHHRAVTYRPDVKTGVQHVQKLSNNITAVTVGPKNEKPVVNVIPKSFPQQRQIVPQKPLLMGMLTSRAATPAVGLNLDRNLVKKLPPVNDLRALKNNIFPYNVENLVEKMGTMTQAFSLTLNSIRTDLAIAKLSQLNMYQAKQIGATQMKNGLEVFFNQLRELLNVQLVSNYSQANAPSDSLGDVAPLSSSALTSTPNGKSATLVNSATNKLDESAIPIEIDDSSPVKKVEKKEKMEIDNDVMITENDSKDVVEVTDSDTQEAEVVYKDKAVKEEKVNGETEKSGGSAPDNEKNENSCEIKIDEGDKKMNDDVSESIADDNVGENKTECVSKCKSTARKHENIENAEEKCDDENESDETPEKESMIKEKDSDMSQNKQNKKMSKEIRSEDDEETNEGGEKSTLDDSENAAAELELLEESENTAAELELLKEMADELNEQEENSKEPRRSSRNRKSEKSEVRSDSDKESPARRSSRNRKSEKSEVRSDSDKESPARRSSRQRLKPDRDSKEKTEGGKKDKSSSSKEQKNTSGDVDGEVSKKERKSPRKPVGGSRIDYDIKSDDELSEKKETKKDKAANESKSGTKKKDLGSDDETEEEVVEKKSKKTDNKKQIKSTSKDKVVSDSEEEEQVAAKKKDKKSEDKKKGSSKVFEDEDNDLDDEVPMEESDTTESSDESVEEFGKRKKKRKLAAKEEIPIRKTRSKDKKSETNTEVSDSDSEFDPELEKEIKSLSKDTRLTRKKAKDSQDTKKESQSKKEKPKEKGEKKGSKKMIVEDKESDLSSGIEENFEVEENDSEDDTDNLSSSHLKKLKQAGKAVMEDESEDEDRPDDISDSSDDHEVSFPKIGSSGKSGKGTKHGIEDSEDSDFETPKKKKRTGKKLNNKLLDAKISDSESDTGKKRKKGKKGTKKRKKDDSDAFSELSDEAANRKTDAKGKKRRRIKKIDSSDEEPDKEPGAEDEIGSDEDDDGTQGGFLKRKQIRKVIGSKKLTDETKAAQKAEEERRKRIEERQKEYNTYVEVEGGETEEEELPEGTEREIATPVKTDSIAKILGSPRKVPITTKCVLEMNKEKKKPLIEVDKTLVRKLKPHQVEAVRFMYNCCVESIERLKKEEGSGCILAHCMGLGKTLSVITFVHTMLANVKLTKMSKCLVVCPLNTCLNWVNEFEIWLDDVDFEIEVYEMSRVKQNFERAQMLKEWHEGGAAVMIMGYDMYRNLVNGSHCKNKKQKKIFYETLADPGPDLVVCDEGHVLKNDVTSLSKAMSRIATKRRIVLTGTPLQNNLGEYHCMVSFVKPSLLGTRKEFNNRFCNPIINGQCSDSTPFDVKLMKRRAHILHELLAGCVQRKDYSALTKFLPPKFEYVISVRLSPVQMTLYEKYLEMNLGSDIRSKGARLFTDYQALMRIWTHPWVLKLDEIRQENKRTFDDEDEDSFIEDSDSYEDSFVDDSTTSPSDASDGDMSSSSNKKKKKKKRKTRGNKDSSSSGDESAKMENPDEVVKKWKSKRRGNEEGAGSSWMEDMGYSQGPKEVTSEWWAEYVKEEDQYRLELSGKLLLMFEILKMCEDIGDKVLIFSQSLLSLDIIEDFLAKVDEANNPTNENMPSTSTSSEASTSAKENGEEKEKTQEEKNKEKLSMYGKSWSKGLDYFRMDGSTNSQNRKSSQDQFNDPENYRARLFLISTKAGSLGINLVSANRVIIFDASWNPSHDIQSIFRVYRFGQVKPVYVYRFLAQGTMEEKIYERQVTKQSLSQRVVDEHQIERHFTSSDLQELYRFQPERLDDPEKKDKPLPILPKDHMLAELMTNNKDWIVKYHEHDSLLENVVEQELSEEEKKAAWEDYENEKKGISSAMGGMQVNPAMLATQQMTMQNLLMQGQASLGQAAVLQIVQDLKARFPNLPPEVFQQRVQAVLRQVLTQQIMQQSEMQRRQIDQQRMNELNRLNMIKQEIQRQQAMINNQQRAYSMGNPSFQPATGNPNMHSILSQGLRPQTLSQLPVRPNMNFSDQQKK